ncbi:MAG: DNA repair protein RecO [Desulfomonilaceae bacterium]|nr:DNA repair protein RecO [Desulfomonilaceae bacterium]
MESIILRKQDWGEADELVVFLTRDLGRLTGVAKNAKKSRVRFGGHLEPLALVDLSLRSRKRDDLVWIDEAQAMNGFLGIRADLSRVAKASYFSELGLIFLPEGHPEPAVFDFLIGFLESLQKADPGSLLFMLDEIQFLALLGYAPRFDVCPACGKPVDRGEDALFSGIHGGACHRGCLNDSEDRSLPLSPDTLAIIRKGLTVERGVVARLRLNSKGLQEMRQALSAFVRSLRGAEIKSLFFLEEMRLW